MSIVNDRTAIVADDHELFRSALVMLLKRDFGFGTVMEASCLAQIFEHLAQSADVAFISIDLAMPGMEGATTLGRLREQYPKMLIAVVTGSEQRDDILQSLGAGINGFIPKSLRVSEMAQALQLILDGNIFVPRVVATSPRLVDRSAPAIPSLTGNLEVQMSALSPRQQDVLQLMSLGKSNKEIARELRLAEGTVKVHVAALFRTLGAHNRISALAAVKRPNEDRQS